MTITKSEINNLKKIVKKETGMNMKDVEIESFNYETKEIKYSYFKSNYAKVTNQKTTKNIVF